MTLSEKLQKIKEIKEEIRETVNEKGVVLFEEQAFEEYPQAIKNIPQSIVSMLPAPEGTYSINLGVDDAAKGSVSGICAATEGAIVTVKAVPADAGYSLDGWYEIVDEEEEFKSGDLEYRFEVERDRFLLAKFTDAYMFGKNWFYGKNISTTVLPIRCTVFGGGVFVATNDLSTVSSSSGRYFRISTDGINWEYRSGMLPLIRGGSSFTDGTYGDNKMVFITSLGDVLIYYPMDDIADAGRDILPTNMDHIVYLNGIFYGFSSGASKIIWESSDCLNWTEVLIASTPQYFIGIEYGNDHYVLMDRCGLTWISVDGELWSTGNADILNVSCASDSYFLNIVYGDGVFMTCSSYQSTIKIFTSNDGVEWTLNSVLNLSNSPKGLIYGNGVFFLNLNDDVGYSLDKGNTWSIQPVFGNKNMTAVAYGNGTFVGWQNNSTVSTPIPIYSRSRGPALP